MWKKSVVMRVDMLNKGYRAICHVLGNGKVQVPITSETYKSLNANFDGVEHEPLSDLLELGDFIYINMSDQSSDKEWITQEVREYLEDVKTFEFKD